MDGIYNLKDKALEELDAFGKMKDLSFTEWQKADVIAHAAKNLEKVIEACEYEDGGMSGRSYRRNAMGQFSRNGSYGGSYEGSYRGRSMRGSSMHGSYGRSGNGSLEDALERMMQTASEQDKEIIGQWMEQLERR